ncbi:hypothetical protein Sjap_021517 [Stephania japonica]|uniref:AP2/ERF domain-containing protein n=1 Tax=Stephania japonica TaxID=461633 RepID=A0AAP0EPQ4_9MAGN
MVKTEIVSKIQSDPSSSSSVARNKKKYKGVRMRSWGSWVSEIRAPNQKTRIWLGSYSTAEAAARAYDAALLCLKGSSANLNFPLSQSPFIPDTTMSPKSIQRVAAAAANASHHHTLEDNATIEANGGAASPPPPPPPPLLLLLYLVLHSHQHHQLIHHPHRHLHQLHHQIKMTTLILHIVLIHHSLIVLATLLILLVLHMMMDIIPRN